MSISIDLLRGRARLPVEKRLTQGFMPVADKAAEDGDSRLADFLAGPGFYLRWLQRLGDER